MRLTLVLALLVSSLFIISCHTQKESISPYLQNVSDTSGKGVVKYPEPVIQKGDLLSIQIYSNAVDPLVDAPYNLPNMGGASGSDAKVSGFLVDQYGNIEYPRIGTIQVEGLTKQQLADIIKAKFQGQLENPSVIIRYLNFRVTILGEVATPNTYTIPGERINILEAIGMAGDITPDGIKTHVKVVREANGDREIGVIDLTSKDLFNSPFYVLQQNDMVLVETSTRRRKREDQQLVTQRISLALSIITATAFIYNIFK